MTSSAIAIHDQISLPPAIDRFFRLTGITSVSLALELIGRWQEGTLPSPEGIDGAALDEARAILRAIPGEDVMTPSDPLKPVLLPPGGVIAPVGTQENDEAGNDCTDPSAQGPGGI